MKGFVIYPTYRIIENKAYVCLYGRLENGESFLTINYFRHYFYIKKSDLELAKELGEFDFKEDNFKNFIGDEVVKIILNLPSEVPNLRKKFEENQIECYEADIRFPYRFMVDKGTQGSLDIEGHYESSERIDRVYKEPDIKPTDYKPINLKVLSFDIESSSGTEEDKLYCIGIVCGNEKKVFINSLEKVDGAISCNDEAEVLDRFINEIIDLDPDIITGWNVIDFDLNYIYNKCKKNKIEFDIGREPGKCKLNIEESFFRESKADVSGRQVLDGLNLLKVSFIKVEDYKLDTVAKTILGEGKLIHSTGIEKYNEIDNLWKKNKKGLIDYNLKDAELVVRILEKTGVLELSVLRSLLTGMPLDRVNASIASFDSLYIRECMQRRLVVPTKSYVVKEESIKGGYVRESIPGIYDYIIILDFKSLYPSIIRTFNIDPYSYVPDCKGKNLIKAPNGACFRNEDGILPILIQRLWAEREKARKRKDELTRHAIKILMNSFFGIIASPSCRFFDLNMANAITHFGQHILKLTHEEIKKLGYNVVYGDTDSNFVISNAKNLDEAEKIGRKIQDHINKFYNGLVKKEYHRESFLELSYDKCFVKLLMPRLRKSDIGAKKRYAGLVIKNGKEQIQFTGLETVRCLVHQDTKIPLLDSLKPIDKLNLSDNLFTLDIINKEVSITKPVNLFRYWYSGCIKEIEIEGGQELRVTPNHTFFVLVPSPKISRLDRGFCRYKNGQIITKNADELRIGDYLISLENIPTTNKNYGKRLIDLARFMGYFVGEGRLYERYSKRGLHQRRVTITFNKNECEIIEDCEILCYKLFKKRANHYLDNKNCHHLYFDLDRKLFSKIKNLIVINKANNFYYRTLALTHKVPEFILNGNKRVICSFLQAYFDAEGTVSRHLSCTTTSKDLFEGVQYLLRKIGIQYSIKVYQPNLKHKRVNTAYCINIGLNGFKRFYEEIGLRLGYKSKSLLHQLESRNIKRARYIRYLTNKINLRKIKKIKDKEYSGKVYDIEVDSDNKNYFVNYILTHNSDWTDLAKKYQYELINLVFHDKDPAHYTKNFVDDIKKGKYDKLLVYKKSIRKELKDYTATSPPHVKAARKLNSLESNRIEYIITEDGPEPIQNKKHKIDYQHYIDKQIKPIADSVLVFFGSTFDDLINGSRQMGLGDF